MTSVARDSTTGARSANKSDRRGSPVVVATLKISDRGSPRLTLWRLPLASGYHMVTALISVEFLEGFPQRPTDPPVKDHLPRRICEDRHARRFVLDGVLQDLHGLRSHDAEPVVDESKKYSNS